MKRRPRHFHFEMGTIRNPVTGRWRTGYSGNPHRMLDREECIALARARGAVAVFRPLVYAKVK